jgi:hypothetical protein
MTRDLTDSERALAGRRFAFFEPMTDFATNPTLVQLASALLRCGARVELIAEVDRAFPQVNLPVRTWPYPQPLSLRRLVSRRAPHAIFRRTVGVVLRNLCRAGYYDAVFGVDPDGAVTAHAHIAGTRTPLVYLSFEIFFEDELRTKREREAKEFERAASRAASLIIVQDEVRAKLLAQENRISESSMLHVPVSPASQPRAADTRLWHRLHGLSDTDVVVLHSGTFAAWTYAAELLESAKRWDPRFVLVVHTRSAGPQPVAASADRGRIIMSTKPAPADQYDELVASADICLALYKPESNSKYTGKNIEHIGLASGKSSYYLKYEKPIVTVAQPSLGATLARYGAGENVPSFDELPSALLEIAGARERYAAGARALFAEICFEARWPELARALAGLVRQKSS